MYLVLGYLKTDSDFLKFSEQATSKVLNRIPLCSGNLYYIFMILTLLK